MVPIRISLSFAEVAHWTEFFDRGPCFIFQVSIAMNNSLRLGQTSAVACINNNVSSGAVVSSQHGKDVSFPPAQRMGRIHAGVKIAEQPKAVRCMSGARNQFLRGSKVGARGAYVGRGLPGVERVVSNGSKWSAGTWLDNKCASLTPCKCVLPHFLPFVIQNLPENALLIDDENLVSTWFRQTWNGTFPIAESEMRIQVVLL